MWFVEKFVWGIMVICILVIAMIFVIDYTAWAKGYTDQAVVVTYDCRIAEISPDIPPAVKEKCRRLKP